MIDNMTVNNDTGVSALEKVANFHSYKAFVISQTVQVLLTIIT